MGRVWIVDSSSLINAKELPAPDQWPVFRGLEAKTADGRLAMPRQVIKELTDISHPDVPGAWAHGVRSLLRHPLDATWESMEKVMARAGDLVDANALGDPADPWIVALALDLREAGYTPWVVTDESVDRPPRICLVTACNRFDIQSCDLKDFLATCGLP